MGIDAQLAVLREDAQADAAVFLRFGHHRGRVVHSDVCVDGESVHWSLMDGTMHAGFDCHCSDDALTLRHGQWCLQAPAERHINRFCWLDEDISQMAPWGRSDAYRHLYEPNGFTEQYRAVLVDQGEVIGWVALLWKQAPRRRAPVATKVEKHLEALRRVAREIHDQPRTTHRYLLDGQGDPLPQNASLHADFDLSALRRPSRTEPTEEMAETVRFCCGYALRTVPMNAEDGQAATLVIGEPLEPVLVDMRKALTTLQRRVADLVAEGRSNKQVGEILYISPNTVKYHLGNYPIG